MLSPLRPLTLIAMDTFVQYADAWYIRMGSLAPWILPGTLSKRAKKANLQLLRAAAIGLSNTGGNRGGKYLLFTDVVALLDPEPQQEAQAAFAKVGVGVGVVAGSNRGWGLGRLA